MKRLAAIALVAAGCAGSDPCAGHAGTCLALRVDGAGVGEIQQLHVAASGFANLDGNTPPSAGVLTALPVSTALYLPEAGGHLELSIAGLRGGSPVGVAHASVDLAPREHRALAVTLTTFSAPDGGAPEGGVADLASEDLTGFDLAGFDLAGVDLVPPPPRHAFLLTARSAVLGTEAAVDGLCSADAVKAHVPGSSTYRAVIAYPTTDPKSYLTLGQGRTIVVPSGATVATDDTFFTALTGPIDEFADGTAAPQGCVWTDFAPNGGRVPGTTDCQGWTSALNSDSGIYGESSAIDINWSVMGTLTCDMDCYVYCLEQ
jgi:hypothetical protein